MTDNQWVILRKYIRDMADELGLKDWKITLMDEPCGEGLSADITSVVGRKVAKMRICPDFLQATAESQRNTIIHELLHLHTDGMRQTICGDLNNSGALSKPQCDIFWYTFDRMDEYCVDGIANAIDCKYPVINWQSSSNA